MEATYNRNLRKFVILLWHESLVSHAVLRQLWRFSRNDEDLERFWNNHATKMRDSSISDVLKRADHIVLQYHQRGAEFILEGEEAYPKLLLKSPSPPLVLVVRGNVSLLSMPQIAIVGSRDTHAEAIESTQLTTSAVIRRGYIPTSGGALGVDALVHRQAMQFEAPTILVSATGIEYQYPKQNADIYEYCYWRGAVVSLYPLGTRPRRQYFPTRNTLIAGLAEAVIIMQCKIKSGALYTATAAQKMNREVFVAAGLPFHPLYAGGLELLSKGLAKIIVNSAQLPHANSDDNAIPWIFETNLDLAFLNTTDKKENKKTDENFKKCTTKMKKNVLSLQNLDGNEIAILRLIENSAKHLEEIHSAIGNQMDIATNLLKLELQGYIEMKPDRRYYLSNAIELNVEAEHS